MVRFRRNLVPGGTYFFTLTLRDRRSNTLTDHVDLLRAAFRAARKRRPFEIVAIAILPEHLHTVMTLPEGDSDYATRLRAINLKRAVGPCPT
jgi:putative transposase